MRADDRFAPGKWRLEAWAETGGISTRGREGEIKPQIVDLTAEQAAQNPRAVLFTYFYSGVPKDAEINFRDGKVDGTFHQKSVDDIAAHDVKIRGTYSPTNFHITFVYRAFGADLEQQFEGKLIDPAR
jgi:hypothetical protein